MRTAVLGHVEWIRFLRVPHMPHAGEIVHATEWYEVPAGGGATAAAQLLKLAGNCSLFTCLGNDELGRRALEELTQMGLTVHAARRDTETRSGVTHVDANGERTITVIGDRLAAGISDDLPWHEFEDIDCVYVTSDDPGTTRLARKARVVVGTARVLGSLQRAGIELDAIVASSIDTSERYSSGDLDPPPRLVALTEGSRGGLYLTEDGIEGRWKPAPLPGPIVDHYGAGDAFAAGLTFALASGYTPQDACDFAARCGAFAIAGRGPYEGQLTLS